MPEPPGDAEGAPVAEGPPVPVPARASDRIQQLRTPMMTALGILLSDDSRFDRRLKAASILSDNISEGELRNRVRAQMALRLVDAPTFPDHADVSSAEAEEDGDPPEPEPTGAPRHGEGA